MCAYVSMFECVCVCVCVCVYVSLCVCVCVCVWTTSQYDDVTGHPTYRQLTTSDGAPTVTEIDVFTVLLTSSPTSTLTPTTKPTCDTRTWSDCDTEFSTLPRAVRRQNGNAHTRTPPHTQRYVIQRLIPNDPYPRLTAVAGVDSPSHSNWDIWPQTHTEHLPFTRYTRQLQCVGPSQPGYTAGVLDPDSLMTAKVLLNSTPVNGGGIAHWKESDPYTDRGPLGNRLKLYAQLCPERIPIIYIYYAYEASFGQVEGRFGY